VGELYALASAVVWALAMIALKKSGETAPPFALNLFRVIVSIPLFLVTLLALGEPLWRPTPPSDVIVLFASGIIGIALSDTLLHAALNRMGAGLTGIVDCLYSPFVVLGAALVLSERLTAWQMAGMVLVVAGVGIASRHEPPEGVTRQRLWAGVVYGVLAMATVAAGIIIAKPVLGHTPVIWATSMRQVGALLVMAPVGLLLPDRAKHFGPLRPHRQSPLLLLSAFLGSYLSVTLWIAGMKYTQVGSAAILNQSSSIFVLVFASLFLGEPFTGRKALAGALAVGGILMVTLG
jgi:drug/metabolite transporter (DMT)-like permease